MLTLLITLNLDKHIAPLSNISKIMFKIAFIGQKGIPVTQGGVEKHVQELSLRLARKGNQVYVYTRPHWVPKEYKKFDQVNLVSLPSLNSKNLDAITHSFISTIWAIFVQKVDIIHYQGVGPSLLAWLPKLLKRKIKVVSTIHSPDWEHQKWSWFARTMLKIGALSATKFSDEGIAVSRDLQKYCLEKHSKDVNYIPNGVADPEAENHEQEKILQQFNLQKNKYILVVSRLVKHKGIHYLIDAFKQLKAQDNKKFKDYKLVIVGSTAFTENYQKYLLKLTENRQDIVFTGAQTGYNLDAIFRNAYLYVQPSESEGLSISVLEAMSYSKAVLLSDIKQNTELITGTTHSGSIGFEFKNKSIKDLAFKLQLLINNPDIVYSVGSKAKKHVKLYYNWEEIAERTQKIYKNIVLIKDKIPSRIKIGLARYIF